MRKRALPPFPRHHYNLRSRVQASPKTKPAVPKQKRDTQPLKDLSPKKEATTCVICLDTEGRMTTVKCGHRFHSKCINCWLKESDSCPVCRFRLRKPNYSFFCIMTSLIVQTQAQPPWNVRREEGV
ncbi:hypothetical protein JTE90_007307 [Oedothorax gibbosus]|uniref:RING-type domain-containing protein n=1 Tax=Oedothorax gibbosus TaxID=931172 RepID=A0AAV6UG72_9ARAC|nr:hypothetical protein JTE90_007307 [Oedothorax gibbosus]